MVDLSPTTYLADANLFIRAGTPARDDAQALIAFFTREPWTLVIHPAVDTELTDEARTYTRHRTLQRAIDDGWATIASLPVDPVAPVTSLEDAARDISHRRQTADWALSKTQTSNSWYWLLSGSNVVSRPILELSPTTPQRERASTVFLLTRATNERSTSMRSSC
jgi:hypothetical protein